MHFDFSLQNFIDLFLIIAIAILFYRTQWTYERSNTLDRIISIAIMDDFGRIHTHRGPGTYDAISDAYADIHNRTMTIKEIGFYTQYGVFLNQRKAFTLALANGQLENCNGRNDNILTPEDL